MSTILITGGTGLVGTALSKALVALNHKVIILTRGPKQNTGAIEYAEWNPDKRSIDRNAIEKADHIVHLAGANVGEKRWTGNRKKEIIESRVETGVLLVNTLREVPNRVQSVVSASAIGWYGPDDPLRRKEAFVESDPPAHDFLGSTCARWEAAIEPVKDLGKRLVILRAGIALSNEGGAYTEFKKPMKFGVATILGSGKQAVSWIHIDDLVEMYVEAITNPELSGVFNAVSPNPVTNEQMVRAIAAATGKKYRFVHVPALALKIALGEMSIEVLKSARVSSKKIQDAGFVFRYPTIETATRKLEA